MRITAFIFLAFTVCRVVLGGDLIGRAYPVNPPPDNEILDMSADPVCVESNLDPVYSRRTMLNENGTLRNVIVFVEDAPIYPDGPPWTPSNMPAIVKQKNCMFLPLVLALQIGQPLILRNSDQTLHNQHLSAKMNPEFNRGLPFAGMEVTTTFKYPEIVRINCDVHRWEHAHVGVFEHPYFSVTRRSGLFRISNLPAGTYKVIAWHEYFGIAVQYVQVGDAGRVPVDFWFEDPRK